MTVTNKTTAYLVAILATIVVMYLCPVDCLACAAISAKITSVTMAESVSKSASVVNTDTHSLSVSIAQTATSAKITSVPMVESVSKSTSVVKTMTHSPAATSAQITSLDALQRRFVDLRFGMFIHFNMPTYVD